MYPHEVLVLCTLYNQPIRPSAIYQSIPEIYSLSIASLPFFYVYDSSDCVDFGITPSHDDCLDVSPSLPWRPLCACSSIDTTTRPQLRRPRPSSARFLRQRLLRPHARLPRHRHKGLPSCMRTHRLLLQPQHARSIDYYDCRGDVRVNKNSTTLCTHMRC